jgi:hypothetical protein
MMRIEKDRFMTQPIPPLQPNYYAPDPDYKDISHLKTLAICQYVYGGLVCAVSLIFIIHLVMGIMMLKGSLFGQPAPPNSRPMGWLFVGMGSGFVVLGETLGILNLVSARLLQKRRGRVFSLVVAGIDCINMPLGTTLGVFMFIVLLRPSVKWLYEQGKIARD